MRKKWILLTTIILLLLATVLIAGCSSGSNPGRSNPDEGSLPSNLAPDFNLKDLNGQEVTLSEFRGSPVMLNFWATWCGPCRTEIPLIQEIFEDEEWSDKGLVILTIDGGETASVVEEFVNKYGASFPVLLDKTQEVFRNYNIRAIPSTFFIDKNGIISIVKIGAFTSKQQIEDGLKQIVE